MAFSQNLQSVTFEAGQDLSAKQYHFVTIASDGQVDPTGDGLQAHGVLQNDPPAAGRAANVGISGITKVVAGGTCTAGSNVSADTNGRAVNTVSGDFALGVACESATTDGQIISILLCPTFGKVW
jgi:hypothetical protein